MRSPLQLFHGPIGVLVDGPHPLLNAALRALLTELPGIEALPAADPSSPEDTLADRIASSSAVPPRLHLLISPRSTDLEGIPALRQRFPTTHVLVYTPTWTVHEVQKALDLGATGCLSGRITDAELAVAIRQAARGEVTLSPDLAWAYVNHLAGDEPGMAERYGSLTAREQEILQLLCQGLSNKAIAQRLFLSVRTVEGHVANLYRKLDVHSRTEAMLVAVQHRLIDGGKSA